MLLLLCSTSTYTCLYPNQSGSTWNPELIVRSKSPLVLFFCLSMFPHPKILGEPVQYPNPSPTMLRSNLRNEIIRLSCSSFQFPSWAIIMLVDVFFMLRVSANRPESLQHFVRCEHCFGAREWSKDLVLGPQNGTLAPVLAKHWCGLFS